MEMKGTGSGSEHKADTRLPSTVAEACATLKAGPNPDIRGGRPMTGEHDRFVYGDPKPLTLASSMAEVRKYYEMAEKDAVLRQKGGF
jgi:hypothetical protein